MAFAESMIAGSTRSILHEARDADGALMNLSGVTLRTAFYRRLGAPEGEALIPAKTPSIAGQPTGFALTTLAAADTAALASAGSALVHWELQAVIGGAYYVLESGALLVKAGLAVATD